LHDLRDVLSGLRKANDVRGAAIDAAVILIEHEVLGPV
jgi:hypothetical protein